MTYLLLDVVSTCINTCSTNCLTIIPLAIPQLVVDRARVEGRLGRVPRCSPRRGPLYRDRRPKIAGRMLGAAMDILGDWKIACFPFPWISVDLFGVIFGVVSQMCFFYPKSWRIHNHGHKRDTMDYWGLQPTEGKRPTEDGYIMRIWRIREFTMP